MRWFTLVSLLLSTACGANEIEQQRLQDGSLKITCQLSMDECLRRVQDQCKNQRYRIHEGTSETRLRDAPPFERAYHTSRLHLTCNDDGADVLLSIDSAKPKPPSSAPKATVCSTGQTRECVGAAACKGGQACLPDGSGFGPCDCGDQTPKAPASAADPATSAPATAPAEAPAVPATSP
jgi:hypothetical protein